jgi:hypothetical protein
VAPSAERPHDPVADLEVDAVEGPLRRAGEVAAVRGVEVAAVAGADQLAGLVLVVDDAGEVGAPLAVAVQLVGGRSDQDRGVVLGRVAEQVGAGTGMSSSATTSTSPTSGRRRTWVIPARNTLPIAAPTEPTVR